MMERVLRLMPMQPQQMLAVTTRRAMPLMRRMALNPSWLMLMTTTA
jgi:hypothetical protein